MLILSGSRALEFVASQVSTVLGNLVLSRRDSLLVDVRSTVPGEEVTRLRYSPLPETVFIFPSPLLDSELTKMRADANDTLIQHTLHPPRIPWKTVAAGGSPGSSSTGLTQASSPGARSAQKQSSTSSTSGQSGKKRKSRKGKASFSSSFGGSGCSGGKGKGAGKKSTWRDVSPVESRGLPGSALETVAGDRSGVLGRDRSPGRLPCSLHGLSSSPFSHPGIVSDVTAGSPRLPKEPWKSPETWVPAFTVVFSWWRRHLAAGDP